MFWSGRGVELVFVVNVNKMTKSLCDPSKLLYVGVERINVNTKK